MPRCWWQLPSCLCRIDLPILPRRRRRWLGHPWALGLFEKGGAALCPGGAQKGKEMGWGVGGVYSEEPAPCTASSWAERFEASLWDFLLVPFHLVRGLGGKYGAQALKTMPGQHVQWWQLTKPPNLPPPHHLPVTALQVGWAGRVERGGR